MVYKPQLYSPFWPRVPSALHTNRLSANSPRTLASMIASSDGGAGGFRRVYKYNQYYNKMSPEEYFFTYLGGNRANTLYFYNLFANKRR
jgi:hypothetical protein